MRKVTLKTYEHGCCWWAKLVEHGEPVEEGRLPNLGQSLFWSGATEAQALDKAKAFVNNARLAVGV